MQDTTLANVRTRATNVLSTAALLTSIGVAVGFINTDPHRGATLPHWAAWALLAGTLLIGVLVLYVQWPVNPWTFGPHPSTMRERRCKADTEDQVLEYVTENLVAALDRQVAVLVRRQKAFRWAAATLLADVSVLIAAGLMT